MKNKVYSGIVKIGQVVSTLYIPQIPKLAVIVAQGGPGLGDNGKSEYLKVCKKYSAILMIPDYIGHCRSEGLFNFENCIETLHICEQFLLAKTTAIEGFTGNKLTCPKVGKIILIGSSWGGAITPFIHMNKKTTIKNLGLISPMTDWSTLGNGKYTEENAKDVDSLIRNVMFPIYRGYNKSNWPKIFFNKKIQSKYNPIDNTHLLKNMNIYIVHGNKDRSIHWSRSKEYFNLLNQSDVATKVYWKLLLNYKHGGETKSQGLEYILENFHSK